jgi:hypothetical protein
MEGHSSADRLPARPRRKRLRKEYKLMTITQVSECENRENVLPNMQGTKQSILQL